MPDQQEAKEDLCESKPLASMQSALSPSSPVIDEPSIKQRESSLDRGNTMKIQEPQQLVEEYNKLDVKRQPQSEIVEVESTELYQLVEKGNKTPEQKDEHVDEAFVEQVEEQQQLRPSERGAEGADEEPDELIEQSELIDGVSRDAEPEHEHKGEPKSEFDIEPREPKAQDSNDERRSESEERIEASTETLGQQVVDADELVAEQINSIINMNSSAAAEQDQEQEVSSRSRSDTSSPPVTSGTLSSVSISTEISPIFVPELDSNAIRESQCGAIDICDYGHQKTKTLVDHSSSNINIDEDLADDAEDDEVLFEDFYSESPSKQNLRRLKMDASEDVLVCEKNRDSMEAARSLFEALSRQRFHKHHHQYQQVSQKRVDHDYGKLGAAVQRSGSLSSQDDTPDGEENDDDGLASTGGAEENNNGNSSQHSRVNRKSSSLDDEVYDLKIIRRSGSSLSASGFRRTLVCSVSPSSQMDLNSDMSLQDAQTMYPIDGDEMLQCKAAFRENKRLIENHQRQQETCGQANGHDGTISWSTLPKLTAPVEATNSWTLRNKNNFSLPNCTHCKRKLYPVDKMELDFTRTTLNIHRNCFKCQICSSMLRLETYAAIDAKLYCPAHAKCVTTTR